MNEADALDFAQAAIWAVIVASSPAIIAAIVVGVTIALLQALTQVQEMTLTFIPKIVAILFTLILFAPFIGGVVFSFATMCYSRIENGF